MKVDRLQRALEDAKTAIEKADALIILAGAGLGVDSGLPDFRGKNGFWRVYPMLKRRNLSFYDLASPEQFERSPKLAWGFYGQRLNLYRKTQPNAFFELMKQIGESLPHQYFVYTSNVDGQFQKGGFDSDRIFECHGSINHVQTLDHGEVLSAKNIQIDVDEETLLAENLPYNDAGELLRPNILMFDDYGWNDRRSNEQKTRYHRWLQTLPSRAKVVLIEVGAGNAIPTVRRESMSLKKRFQAFRIQVNPETDCYASARFSMGALEAHDLWQSYGITGLKKSRLKEKE